MSVAVMDTYMYNSNNEPFSHPHSFVNDGNSPSTASPHHGATSSAISDDDLQAFLHRVNQQPVTSSSTSNAGDGYSYRSPSQPLSSLPPAPAPSPRKAEKQREIPRNDEVTLMGATRKNKTSNSPTVGAVGPSNWYHREPKHDPSLHAPPPHHGRSTSSAKASSTTSEFTKRKNWAHRIIEELQDFLHVLSPSGQFIYVSPSVHDLTGWTEDELVGASITDYLHPDDVASFLKRFQSGFDAGDEIKIYYRFRTKTPDGSTKYQVFEVIGSPFAGAQDNQPLYVGQAVFNPQQSPCFVAMARLYPGRTVEMLDSFLEIKIENERLRQELNQLYAEIEQEDGLTDSRSAFASGNRSQPFAGGSGSSNYAMSNVSHSSRHSGTDRGSIDPSNGIVDSSGLIPSHGTNTYGALGIGIGAQHAKTAGGMSSMDADKKRKAKQREEEGEFVCRDCGTVDSPEWRKGPLGPKTLCNACGLRWAKKSKTPKTPGMPGTPRPSGGLGGPSPMRNF